MLGFTRANFGRAVCGGLVIAIFIGEFKTTEMYEFSEGEVSSGKFGCFRPKRSRKGVGNPEGLMRWLLRKNDILLEVNR